MSECLVYVAGALAQLLAVGLSSGEVALYKLWATKGGEPLRIISLADWGYEPEVTGSVADLQWSPDNRALAVRLKLTLLFWSGTCRSKTDFCKPACTGLDKLSCWIGKVGWRRSGLGLWTPSGCRLLCSVRQARTAPMHNMSSSFKSPPPLSFEVTSSTSLHPCQR